MWTISALTLKLGNTDKQKENKLSKSICVRRSLEDKVGGGLQNNPPKRLTGVRATML